ncbi:hypothetical protein QQS21_001231 [Conoideocrella luteorostrata]|uniref:Uncharacterized protein n=1 Tax=Conoideocrella luteorostrata TaxID=1105319 RepID=A0AAJ0G277_9HYPO|nr:hypothetical protein QQS21_001231 [Conoideocrella luteorostrata]
MEPNETTQHDGVSTKRQLSLNDYEENNVAFSKRLCPEQPELLGSTDNVALQSHRVPDLSPAQWFNNGPQTDDFSLIDSTFEPIWQAQILANEAMPSFPIPIQPETADYMHDALSSEGLDAYMSGTSSNGQVDCSIAVSSTPGSREDIYSSFAAGKFQSIQAFS